VSDAEIPQAIELYAINSIPNLSEYALGSGNDGQETTLQGSLDAGRFLYVTNDATSFETFFLITADLVGAAAVLSGSEAIELFRQGEVVDVFGNTTIDNGTATPWNYVDGWAYRRDATGPDNSTFALSNWIISPDVFLTAETNEDGDIISFPISTYSRILATPQPTPAPGNLYIYIIYYIYLYIIFNICVCLCVCVCAYISIRNYYNIADDDDDDEGTNQGEVVGAIIGVLCALALIGAIACYCRRKQILAKTAGTAATAVNPNNVSSSAAELGIVPESGV